jgi:two-component system, response regulator YesN
MFIFRKLFKKHSIFITFLISYLLMLLVAIAIGGLSYSRYSSVIKKQMENYNVAMLQQAQSILDEKLISIQKLVVDIGQDSFVQRLLYAGSEMDGSDKFNISKTVELLAKNKNRDNIIDSLYIYLRNPDLIISNSSSYVPTVFYNEDYRYTVWSIDEWQELLKNKCFIDYKASQRVKTSSEERQLVSVFQSLPFEASNRTLGMLVVSIDSTSITNMLNEINVLNKGAVYITDSSNKVILGTGNEELLKAAADGIHSTKINYSYKKFNGQEVIISNVPSMVNGWSYISIIPTKLFMQELNYVHNITLIIVMIFLLFGIVLAYLFAKYNFKPIQKICNNLKNNVDIDVEEIDMKNEIEYISIVTNKTIQDYSDVKNSMIKQIPVLQANFLAQLLKGNISEEDGLLESLESLGLNFKYERFVVLLINIDEYSENTLKERNLMKFVIANIMEKVENEMFIVYTVDIDTDRTAVIINMQEISTKTKEDLFNLVKKVMDFVKDKFNTIITVGVGGFQNEIDNIKISYHQALKAIEYQLLQVNGKIVFADNIPATEKSYFYPIEIEMKLINSIKIGDINKVQELLKNIFEKNFDSNTLSLEMARCLFFDIMSTAIKVISNSGADYEGIFGSEVKHYGNIIGCKNINEMKEVLKTEFCRICSYINDNKKSRNTVLIENITEYINIHFNSQGLSLVSVADAFSINPNYLSGYFKEQTGENFMNYVNNVRLGKVKDLLKETTMSLQDISKKVGYSNSGVLIRNFKKYEGITPGEYREKIV